MVVSEAIYIFPADLVSLTSRARFAWDGGSSFCRTGIHLRRVLDRSLQWMEHAPAVLAISAASRLEALLEAAKSDLRLSFDIICLNTCCRF